MENSLGIDPRRGFTQVKWYEMISHYLDVMMAFVLFAFNSFTSDIAPKTQLTKTILSIQNLFFISKPDAIGREAAFLAAQAYQIRD